VVADLDAGVLIVALIVADDALAWCGCCSREAGGEEDDEEFDKHVRWWE